MSPVKLLVEHKADVDTMHTVRQQAPIWLIVWGEPFAESTVSQIKLIVRSSTKVLLKTGAVVEEGAVQWVILRFIILA